MKTNPLRAFRSSIQLQYVRSMKRKMYTLSSLLLALLALAVTVWFNAIIYASIVIGILLRGRLLF